MGNLFFLQYPDWLADNRSKIDAAEYEKYNRQYAIMQQVCTEFESEAANDDDAVKSARFERILTLMQQMQECGHPPKELAGEAVNLPNPFGAAADLAQAGAGLPAGAQNCVVLGNHSSNENATSILLRNDRAQC